MLTDAVADRIDRMVAINTPFSGSFDPVILEGSRLEAAKNIEPPLSGHFRPPGQSVLLDAVMCAVDGTQGTE